VPSVEYVVRSQIVFLTFFLYIVLIKVPLTLYKPLACVCVFERNSRKGNKENNSNETKIIVKVV